MKYLPIRSCNLIVYDEVWKCVTFSITGERGKSMQNLERIWSIDNIGIPCQLTLVRLHPIVLFHLADHRNFRVSRKACIQTWQVWIFLQTCRCSSPCRQTSHLRRCTFPRKEVAGNWNHLYNKYAITFFVEYILCKTWLVTNHDSEINFKIRS